MELLQSFDSSQNKRHELLTWITNNHESIVSKINDPKSPLPENISDDCLSLYNQLNDYFKFLIQLDDQAPYESHFISIRLSQLYNLLLLNLEKDYNSKIFDSAELLTNILLEENVLKDNKNNSTNDHSSNSITNKSKKSSSNSKKTYTYSPIKDIAATILIQMFEIFGKKIKLLTPNLLIAIFKNIKKMMEKNKYKHATYMTTLFQLLNSMIRNCGLNIMDSNFISKFNKISKLTFEDIYNDNQDFPIYFISIMIELWSNHFKQDSFIKDHSSNLLNTFYTRFIQSDIAVYGFSNDQSRILTSKVLSEILFYYYFNKKIVNLNDIWNFYKKFFIESISRDFKAGCMESLTHFISLCLSIDKTFLSGIKYLNYLKILLSVFDEELVNKNTTDSTTRDMRFFENFHKLILPYLGDSSKTQILFKLLGVSVEPENNQLIKLNKSNYSIDNNSNTLTISDNPKLMWLTLSQLHLCKILLNDLSSSFATDDSIIEQIKSKLLNLATCDTFMLRIESIVVFKIFLSHFPEYLSDILEKSLKNLTADFQLKDDFPFAKNHGNTLLIANLISLADKEYVAYELIMRITIFATSFIKQHTTSTQSSMYHKGIICWILLMGLMNYQDEQHLEMQSAQLFIFWKVLLTHTFTYRNEDELYKNLEIRNHALTCLLTYLNRAKLNSDTARQISYLLTKCSNFNHSVTLKSTNIDSVLLVNESKILQVYLKIHEYVKGDFNSSLLILIIKNFSNPYLFQETNNSYFSKSSGKQNALKEEEKDTSFLGTSVNTLLHTNDKSALGLSSKINYNGIAELSIKSPKNSLLEISGSWPSNDYNWYNGFENEVMKPISPIFSMDYLIILYGKGTYSGNDIFSPRLTTSVIDASMELFSMVYPHLNSKIQYSVMENLNLSMFSKMTTPLRSIAIAANICVVIYNALRIIQEKELILDEPVGKLMLNSISKIEFYNDSYITRLKSACTGLIIAAVARGMDNQTRQAYITEHGNIIIKRISDMNEPYFRVYYAMSLASIFKYNPQNASFSSFFDIIIALVNDPHPVVHSWSLKAMHVLLEKYLAITPPVTSRLLNTLEDVLTNPNFGQFGSSTLRYNYNIEYNSYTVISQIVCTLSENLGPNLKDLNPIDIYRYRNIVNSGLLSEDVSTQLLSFSAYHNIATFKLTDILNDTMFITAGQKTLISSILPGFGSNYFNSKFTRNNELIPETSTLKGASEVFKLFAQLIKLQKKELFIKQMDSTAWLFLALYPSSDSVIEYFTEWLLNSIEEDHHWFDKLYAMFNMPRGRLFNGFYKNVDKLLDRMGLQTEKEVELKRDEEKSINPEEVVGKPELTDDLADTIQWRSKQAILKLLTIILQNSKDNKKLFLLLSSKLPELIRMSFQASTMRIIPIKKTGLEVLDFILTQYSSMRDPENPSNYDLEQQEAQITSALMPAFGKGSSPDIISSAIIVSAQFLSSSVAPLNRLGRISHLLIDLLGDFENKNATIKVGEASILTQKARRKIELSSLNAWAQIVEKALLTKNDELITFTKGYWNTLIYLWIISLREYVMVKYESIQEISSNTSQSKNVLTEIKNSKLELYKPVWLNFVETLGCLLEENKDMILECLNEDEIESFMFILLTQCLEAIIKNIDNHSVKKRVLPALHNILKCGVSLESLFEDNIHLEVSGTLERLIIIGDEDEKLVIVNIIDDLLKGYLSQNSTTEAFLSGVDKLYEYLRLLLIIVSSKLPFIKFNSFEEHEVPIEKLTSSDLELIKYAFTVFQQNVSKFDSVFKFDLDACLLYIIGKILESDTRNNMISIILPLLRDMMKDFSIDKNNDTLITIFFSSTKEIIFHKLTDENKIATLLVFATNGYSSFTDEEIDNICKALVEGLGNTDLQAISIQSLKAIINKLDTHIACKRIMKNILQKFSQIYISIEAEKQARIILEIVTLFTKKTIESDSSKILQSFALCITFIIWFYDKTANNLLIAGDKLMELAAADSENFKATLNTVLTIDQKAKIERLLSDYDTESKSKLSNKDGLLKLKSFS
ncbi:hypothetical protein TBLA_0A05840 [Henningerozyma blattae CBS 6284]|uniref:LAA1-like C-terminal TPR repeats domain-containing protein n=1 Tax=Henningerozyma blattae (strain ATCC 34711 / CBS 6284 / DSM 70876 / NBRC 10599 / NRRL Y-10934 / UCD 77-7) TaxID=1071380 RepID=I2GW75_HENB6|nr:hypothetical protein TBLA_0A05840 [Tetrapisispora blattae CBS 6284]CCH58377.1 hypothetical protein TBLA_0A05840 [Tetrapisispora blattae CBS 6284]